MPDQYTCDKDDAEDTLLKAESEALAVYRKVLTDAGYIKTGFNTWTSPKGIECRVYLSIDSSVKG